MLSLFTTNRRLHECPQNLQPLSETSAIILSSTGSTGDVAAAVPFGMYTGSAEFITGAARQVKLCIQKTWWRCCRH